MKAPRRPQRVVTQIYRVCPKCLKQWSDEWSWIRDTEFVGFTKRNGCTIGESLHLFCGGRMFDEGWEDDSE